MSGIESALGAGLASTAPLGWATAVLTVLAVLATLIAAVRIVRGPRHADRVVALDIFLAAAVALCVAASLGTGRTVFLDVAIGLDLAAVVDPRLSAVDAAGGLTPAGACGGVRGRAGGRRGPDAAVALGAAPARRRARCRAHGTTSTSPRAA